MNWCECNACREVFPEHESDVRSDYIRDAAYGHKAIIERRYYVCPSCGSADIKSIGMCSTCPSKWEPNPAEEGADQCAECLQAETSQGVDPLTSNQPDPASTGIRRFSP